MTGIAQFNFPAFHEATRVLRLLKHDVFNPAEHDEGNGFDPSSMTGHENLTDLGFSLRDMLQADTHYICKEAEALCLLPGWRNSRGAVAELALARALGLKAGALEDFMGGTLVPAETLFSELLRGGR